MDAEKLIHSLKPLPVADTYYLWRWSYLPQMIQNCDLDGTLYTPVSKIGSVNGILVTGAIKRQEKGHLAMILI